MTCGLLTASSDAGSDGKERAARGSRSAGTRPGILTGVLEATVRDPQVRTPAARLNYGFVFHSAPASRAARPYCPPPRTTAPAPARTRQRPQPAATGTDPHFHAARPPPDEMAKLAQLGSHREPGLRITDPCPRDVPEPPSIASDRHQQQPAKMKLGRALNPRATHENTLVMCSSSRDIQDDLGGPVVPSANDAGKSGAGQRVTYLLNC
jgi:hypothetical protein